MTVQTQIEIRLSCRVCGNTLTVESSPTLEKRGWHIKVEPCEKCGLTQRAVDVATAPVCNCIAANVLHERTCPVAKSQRN